MTRDEVVSAGLVTAFAALVTAHVALVAGLAARPPRWRALGALVVPVLAPWWGHRERMWARTHVWTVSAVAYGVLWWLSGR